MQMVKIQIPDRADSAKAMLEMSRRGRIEQAAVPRGPGVEAIGDKVAWVGRFVVGGDEQVGRVGRIDGDRGLMLVARQLADVDVGTDGGDERRRELPRDRRDHAVFQSFQAERDLASSLCLPGTAAARNELIGQVLQPPTKRRSNHIGFIRVKRTLLRGSHKS